MQAGHSIDALTQRLEKAFDVEFTFHKVDKLVDILSPLDRNTPSQVRAVLLGAAAYFVLPADLVPDLLAGIGFTDDAAVLAAALTAVGRHLRPEHRAEARRRLDELRRAG